MERKELLRALGAMIRAARKARRMTQAELSRQIGYETDPGTEISKLERGVKAPPPARFQRLCEVLDLEIGKAAELLAAYRSRSGWLSIPESLRGLPVEESPERYRKADEPAPPDDQIPALLNALDDERRRRVVDVLLRLAKAELREQEEEKV